LIRQPTNVATPATALLGFVVQVRVAPAGVVMLRVTPTVLLLTVRPPASATVTTGWTENATPPVPSEGSVVTSRLVAAPKMLKPVLTAAVSPPAVAVSV
jgi:hypothetical protein